MISASLQTHLSIQDVQLPKADLSPGNASLEQTQEPKGCSSMNAEQTVVGIMMAECEKKGDA